MASESLLPDRINEEILSCSICFGTYSNGAKLPKLLSCSHTFCLECIEEYLNNHGRNKDKFLCPMCRKENQLSKGGVKDFPNNLTILGLLDLVSSSSKSGHTNTTMDSAITSMQTEVSTVSPAASGGPMIYPSLPQDIEPYRGFPITASQPSLDLPIIEADPNKCYECSKPKPKITLKCGHSICKACKKRQHIRAGSQSMCPLCTDLQAASMLLAESHVPAQPPCPQVNKTATPPAQRADRVESPMEGERPPPFNPSYSSDASASSTPTNVPTRVAPAPPGPPQRPRNTEMAGSYPLPPAGGAIPRETSSPPPPPPPRRLPGEILGSPLKCLKKIGSYSDVKMQTNAFKGPTRVSMYKNGNFLVVDEDNMTVQVFNKRGEYISLFKAMGVQGACFYTPEKIAVATHRGIDIYNINGAPSGDKTAVGAVNNVVTYKLGFLAMCDKSLAIYSQDLQVSKEIKKKVRAGVFQRGSAFDHVKDVAISTHNDIAVLDSKAGEIYLLNEEGLIKLVYTPATESCGPLRDPYAIAFDRFNNLYVADTGNKRVLKFYANGRFARCVLNFALGNTKQVEANTTVYGLSSADVKHLVMAIHGEKTAEVRLYDV